MSLEDIPQPAPDLRGLGPQEKLPRNGVWARPTGYSYCTQDILHFYGVVPTDSTG